MSGRAGRRGKDDRGYAIMLVEDGNDFTPTVAQSLVRGAPKPLVSRFKLSYYTLLNLSKQTEGGIDRMEYLIAHSFQQFQHEKAMPTWKRRLDELNAHVLEGSVQGMMRGCCIVVYSDPERYISCCEAGPTVAVNWEQHVYVGLTQQACEEYVNLKDQIGSYSKLIHEFTSQPGVCTRFLTSGRQVRVQEGATNWRWGIVLTCSAVKRNRNVQVRCSICQNVGRFYMPECRPFLYARM